MAAAKASVYPATDHSNWADEASRSSWTAGRATLRTVLSTMSMNTANRVTASVAQRLGLYSAVGVVSACCSTVMGRPFR